MTPPFCRPPAGVCPEGCPPPLVPPPPPHADASSAIDVARAKALMGCLISWHLLCVLGQRIGPAMGASRHGLPPGSRIEGIPEAVAHQVEGQRGSEQVEAGA